MPPRGSGLPSKTRTKSGADLARFAGVSENTIKNWRKIEDFPRDETGATVLWEFAEWMLRRDGRLDVPKEAQSREERFEAAELLAAEADAVRKETLARRDIGELIERRAARTMVAQLCNYVRSRLQALPTEMASEIPDSVPADPQQFLDLCQRFRESVSLRMENRIETVLIGMATWRSDEDSPSSTSMSTDSVPDSSPPPTSGSKPKSSRRGSGRGRSPGAAAKSRRS